MRTYPGGCEAKQHPYPPTLTPYPRPTLLFKFGRIVIPPRRVIGLGFDVAERARDKTIGAVARESPTLSRIEAGADRRTTRATRRVVGDGNAGSDPTIKGACELHQPHAGNGNGNRIGHRSLSEAPYNHGDDT